MTGTVAGVVSAALFLWLYFSTGAGFFGSLILSGAGYVGLAILSVLSDRRKKKKRMAASTASASAGSRSTAPTPVDPAMRVELERALGGTGISVEEFLAALREGSRKLGDLKRAADRISSSTVRAKAYAVCDSVARIIADVREDPKDLRPARKFLGYYLDATITVADRYAALASRTGHSQDLDEALARAESSLDTIRAAYDHQLAQLLENDAMNLDVEVDVLEKTIRAEGLGQQ